MRSGRDYGIPISGTMAHSFVQRYDKEIDSFRDFAEIRPHDAVFLVDTYDTLKSGVPNAITVAKEMEERGEKLKGIRLDSGDLAWLAKESREMLDEAGLDYVKIAASNQIDEHIIKSLLSQQAPIDLFGVGTTPNARLVLDGEEERGVDAVAVLCKPVGDVRLVLFCPEAVDLRFAVDGYLLAGQDFPYVVGVFFDAEDDEQFHSQAVSLLQM
ncbi:MAG: hypothetical protein U5K31_12260 [Balneolaceae bacterium]|nr:hypothetical protein [Balneolaceae bacterium]